MWVRRGPVAVWLVAVVAGGAACSGEWVTEERTAAEQAGVGLDEADQAGRILAEAERAARAAGEEAPDPHDALRAQAIAELGAERVWRGLWLMERVLHDDPEDAEALRAVGLIAYTQGRWADATAPLHALDAIRRLGRDELVALGDASSHLNRFAASESLFTRALELSPDESPLHFSRGWARRRLGRLDDAANDFEEAAALDARAQPPRIQLASIRLDQGRLDDARLAIEPLLTSEPGAFDPCEPQDSTAVLVIAAHLAERRGDPQNALARLGEALARDPENLDALHLLILVRRSLGDRPGAREASARHEAAVRALENEPFRLAMISLVQGAIAEEAGDFEAAIAFYRRGLDEDPENRNLHCLLAALYRRLDRGEEGRASLGVLRRMMGGSPPGVIFLATGKDVRDRGFPAVAAAQFDLAARRGADVDEATYFHALSLAEAGEWEAALGAASRFE